MANWAKLQEDTVGLPVYKRARHGIHFKQADGQILANFCGKPAHYLDGGLWKPIDTKLLAVGDGFYGCPHSPVRVHKDGHVKVDGTDYLQRTELPSAQTGLVDGDKLVRTFRFGEQRMWITEDGFKSEIQLNRIPTLTEARKLIASESGTLSKEYLKSLTTATDANGNSHTYSTLSAFRTWLASAVYPVVIDPDFAGGAADGIINGIDADFATARSTGTGVDITTYRGNLGVYFDGSTYRVYRHFYLFDTSSIGSGSTVTQVNLSTRCDNDASATDFDVQIVKQDWSGQVPLTSNADAAFDGCLAGTADDAVLFNTSTGTGTKKSGNLSTAWVSKTGTTYYSLRSSLDYANDSTSSYVRLHLSESATESYRPVLTVTYTAASTAFVNILDHTNSVILGGSIVR